MVLVSIGIISVYLYRQTKKRGFVYIGISFLLQGAYGFVPNQIITNFLVNMFGLTGSDSTLFGALLLVNTIVDAVVVALALVGILILKYELKPKSAS